MICFCSEIEGICGQSLTFMSSSLPTIYHGYSSSLDYDMSCLMFQLDMSVLLLM